MRKEIEGVTYEFALLDALTGRRLFLDLVKAFGPCVSSVESASSLAGLFQGVGGFIQSLDVELQDRLCDTMAKSCAIVNSEGSLEPIQFGKHFAGRYLAMYEWLAVSLEFNYSDFLGEEAPIRKRLRAGWSFAKRLLEAELRKEIGKLSNPPKSSISSSTES